MISSSKSIDLASGTDQVFIGVALILAAVILQYVARPNHRQSVEPKLLKGKRRKADQEPTESTPRWVLVVSVVLVVAGVAVVIYGLTNV